MTLPTSVDLRPAVDKVEDQGSLGACTAFASTTGLGIIYERAGVHIEFSELYQYYWTRADANGLGKEGASPGYMMLSLQKRGVCSEESWPYVMANEEVQPPVHCDVEASQYKINSFISTSIADLPLRNWARKLLASGTPIMISFNVRQAFIDQVGAITDWHHSPYPLTGPIIGGHEVCVIGYDDATEMFLIQNSWGPDWGDGGFWGLSYFNFEAVPTSIFSITSCGVPFVPLAFQPPPTPPVPTASSTVKELLDYIYITQFKRTAEPAGVAYWSAVMLQQMTSMIRAGAQGSDKDVMPP